MAESARDALERATARLSHEIKSALAGFTGALRVLSDRIPPGLDGEVHRIEASVEELARFWKPRAPVLVESSELIGAHEPASLHHARRSLQPP